MDFKFHIDAYYRLKPFIPRRLQLALRRKLVKMRVSRTNIWPIDERAGETPEGWTGWPEGKKFALVLTHDVDTSRGLTKCRELADMEKEMGFRSSFNFVPERYELPVELRHYLTENGFEVGVHDLNHDGKLFKSEKIFNSRAVRINRYIRDWKAQGFRSGAMLRNLKWMHGLEMLYDASTFDTDPFEPQSGGAGTIFPFQVLNGSGEGYVELPYTLPQDFTLFVLMRGRDIDIWKRKLDWIAEKGGMALMAVHPDYMSFNGSNLGPEEYPAQYYEEILAYIKEEYEGQYWHMLPRDVAQFWRTEVDPAATPYAFQEASVKRSAPKKSPASGGKIWIDLDNTPHVPFFRPIIDELEGRGYEVFLTARDCFQVCGLADCSELSYKRIGRHYGKNKLLKLFGLVYRAIQMMPAVSREKPILAISHGSRSQLILASMLGIPSIVMLDYEYARFLPFVHPDWVIAPEIIPGERIHVRKERIMQYPGIKEDVYVKTFRPDPSIKQTLGLDDSKVVVTIRPPATEAHYHNPQSEELFSAIMDSLLQKDNVQLVLMPRNDRQKAYIKRSWPEWCDNGSIVIPECVVDGLNLLWFSDLTISGGGTMNREAAALGVPVYSIFRGEIGAVDNYLADKGSLTLIKNVEDIETKIDLSRRHRPAKPEMLNHEALKTIVAEVIEVIEAG